MEHNMYIESCTELQLFGVIYSLGGFDNLKEYWEWYHRVKKQWESLEENDKVALMGNWKSQKS